MSTKMIRHFDYPVIYTYTSSIFQNSDIKNTFSILTDMARLRFSTDEFFDRDWALETDWNWVDNTIIMTIEI